MRRLLLAALAAPLVAHAQSWPSEIATSAKVITSAGGKAEQ
jgi:hypothetical protein